MIAANLAPPSPLRRLVIVEDEGILALDIQRHLVGAGFDVRGVAADSESAIALVEAEKPDLVLMDIRIQGELDGIETAAALRARFDVPVVYLTAHSDAKTMERAQLTEPMGYLLKPFKKPDLQNVVTIALARSANERALRRREQALSVTLSCIGEAIVTTSENGRVTYLNLAAEALSGCGSDVARNQPLGDVLRLRAPDGELLGEQPHDDALKSGRVEFQSTLGSRSLAGTAAELRLGATSFGAVLALRDLTDLLLARRQLEFAERLTSLGTLAAGVAHEVNNPLSVVISNVDYALEGALAPEIREALAEASDAAQRVAHIIGELRSLSRPQTEPVQLLEPGEVVGSALSFTKGEWRGVTGVCLDLQPLPAVFAAPTRLAQVLVNLIINAVHAMQGVQGPHLLSISTGTTEQGEPVVTVSDTGVGIPEAVRERIFEPFFTTKPTGKGSGLGLAVSRSIVENQGGRLEVASGPAGKGTSFRLVMPAANRPAAVAAPLRAWWVGAPGEASEALGARAFSADELVAQPKTELPEVFLLAMDEEAARALRARVPETENRSVRVGGEPSLGSVVLRQPFDVRTLTAFVRRSSPGRS